MITITQSVDLSLTESLVPTVIHVKQFDAMARQIKCSIYNGSELVTLDSDTIINVSGTRPDGAFFQYRSDTDTDVVSVSDGKACFWITDAMTASSGRLPVDITIVDGDGGALGTFALVLRVEKASSESAGSTTGSVSSIIAELGSSITNVYVDDDGYLWIETDDVLGITVIVDDYGNVTISY